ncbi:hypothetical protein KUTeg_007090 [Tegillarca granosa]|uniref:VWFA domain-containing protein n=1 Tax=Tegillarca granosa TaxID=220873 RepID=A0ABQ9FGY2_TEGGR|nr:hypothetical protein KUTeg_007090 [Tegillarca granosa]
MFILDRSGSVSTDDFNEAVSFIYNITEWLTIGPSNILVSVLTFSSNFDFDDYVTNRTLLEAINDLKNTTTYGGTRTYDALKSANQILFDSNYGARSNASKAVIVLTDGLSASRTWTVQQAELLESQGAEIFAIGIGSAAVATNAELAGIASDPDDYYLHTLDYFSYLCVLYPRLHQNLVCIRSNNNDTVMDIEYNCPTSAAAVTNTVTSNATVTNTTQPLSRTLQFHFTSDLQKPRTRRQERVLLKIPDGTIEAIVSQYTDAPLGEAPLVFNSKAFHSMKRSSIIPKFAPTPQIAWMHKTGKPNNRLPPLNKPSVIPFDTLIDLDYYHMENMLFYLLRYITHILTIDINGK